MCPSRRPGKAGSSRPRPGRRDAREPGAATRPRASRGRVWVRLQLHGPPLRSGVVAFEREESGRSWISPDLRLFAIFFFFGQPCSSSLFVLVSRRIRNGARFSLIIYLYHLDSSSLQNYFFFGRFRLYIIRQLISIISQRFFVLCSPMYIYFFIGLCTRLHIRCPYCCYC